jgi:predicted nucleotidyltransferase
MRNYIRVMRTNAPPLLPLFRSPMQAELLGLLLLQPERDWTIGELSKTLRATPSSVHREVLRAVDAGLVRKDDRQRPHQFRAAADSPAYPPLRDLLGLTVGVPERLRRALSDSADIQLVALHGSWASGRVRPDSDLDVLVVTDGDRRELRRKITRLGRDIGRDVDASVLAPRALRQLAAEANPFLLSIIRGPRIDVMGDLDELLNADDSGQADAHRAGSDASVGVP